VANANKLNSTVYFFFGVFLGLTALVFFGDLVATIPIRLYGFITFLIHHNIKTKVKIVTKKKIFEWQMPTS
jgi:hypothetical protein